MPAQLPNRLNIWGLFSIGKEREVVRHLPQEHLAIIRRRSDDLVVERTPVRVQHSSSVSSKQRELFRKLALLFERYHRECASTASLPVDCHILRVGFDDVRVPCVLADSQIIVALFSSSRAAEYVSCAFLSAHCYGMRMPELKAYGISTLSRISPTLRMLLWNDMCESGCATRGDTMEGGTG